MGIKNTIGRAELAAITAAILHGHSRTALSVFHLSTKLGNTCFSPKFTATMYKGSSWRCSFKPSAMRQNLYTLLRSNLTQVFLVIRVQIL